MPGLYRNVYIVVLAETKHFPEPATLLSGNFKFLGRSLIIIRQASRTKQSETYKYLLSSNPNTYQEGNTQPVL